MKWKENLSEKKKKYAEEKSYRKWEKEYTGNETRRSLLQKVLRPGKCFLPNCYVYNVCVSFWYVCVGGLSVFFYVWYKRRMRSKIIISTNIFTSPPPLLVHSPFNRKWAKKFNIHFLICAILLLASTRFSLSFRAPPPLQRPHSDDVVSISNRTFLPLFLLFFFARKLHFLKSVFRCYRIGSFSFSCPSHPPPETRIILHSLLPSPSSRFPRLNFWRFFFWIAVYDR